MLSTGNRNGFSMQVFRHTAFLSGFDESANAVSIRPEIVRKIIDEVHRSDLVYTAESFIVGRVLDEGYTIEFSEPGRTTKLTDEEMNNEQNLYWKPELEKALRYGLRFGLYVVQYIEVDGSALDQLGEKIMRPFVLDPEDYVVRFVRKEDGQREYLAYFSDSKFQNEPIPQSRVMLFFEPEPEGTINSPVQKCLESIVLLREYWENSAATDHRLAFPLHQYYLDSKEQALVPNTAPDAVMAPYNDSLQLDGLDLQRGQYENIYSIDMASRAMHTIMRRQVTADATDQSYGTGERYDPLNRRYLYVAKENPALPYAVLPSGVRAESNTTRPTPNPQFKDIVTNLITRISSCLGVPAEFIHDSGKRFAADFQAAQQVVNQTTKFWQKHLEKHIVTMYLDLNYKRIAEHVDAVFDQLRKRHVDTVKRTAQRFTKKDGEDREEAPDEPVQDSGFLLSAGMRRHIERQITISVHFVSNPVLQYSDVKTLYAENVITREAYKSLALNIFGLPASLATTPEEEEAELRQQAKRQKMFDGPDGEQQRNTTAAAAADDSDKKNAGGAADGKDADKSGKKPPKKKPSKDTENV